MKIKVRKMKEEKYYIPEKLGNIETGKNLEKTKIIDTGFIEEIDIENPSKEITAFSLNKNVRAIGIGKELRYLTMNSWKQTKKELKSLGLMYKFDLSKQV